MVDRKLARELLFGIQERLLHERLAHAMSRAAADREFAFELAALIEEHVRDVVAIPPWNTDAASGEREADLLVLPRQSAVHRTDGTLAPPAAWPAGTLAIELAEIRLANGALSYDAALERLRADLADKSKAGPEGSRREASWLGLTVMTDAAWAGTPAREEGRRVAREVRLDRWRPSPPGLLCIGSVFGSMTYGAWRGDVWVEAFLPVADGSPLGADAHDSSDPLHLRVDEATLHEHRRDQYERLGAWGGSADELSLCLRVEERLWRSAGDRAPFERVPGVSQLVAELRACGDGGARDVTSALP